MRCLAASTHRRQRRRGSGLGSFFSAGPVSCCLLVFLLVVVCFSVSASVARAHNDEGEGKGEVASPVVPAQGDAPPSAVGATPVPMEATRNPPTDDASVVNAEEDAVGSVAVEAAAAVAETQNNVVDEAAPSAEPVRREEDGAARRDENADASAGSREEAPRSDAAEESTTATDAPVVMDRAETNADNLDYPSMEAATPAEPLPLEERDRDEAGRATNTRAAATADTGARADGVAPTAHCEATLNAGNAVPACDSDGVASTSPPPQPQGEGEAAPAGVDAKAETAAAAEAATSMGEGESGSAVPPPENSGGEDVDQWEGDVNAEMPQDGPTSTDSDSSASADANDHRDAERQEDAAAAASAEAPAQPAAVDQDHRHTDTPTFLEPASSATVEATETDMPAAVADHWVGEKGVDVAPAAAPSPAPADAAHPASGEEEAQGDRNGVELEEGVGSSAVTPTPREPAHDDAAAEAPWPSAESQPAESAAAMSDGAVAPAEDLGDAAREESEEAGEEGEPEATTKPQEATPLSSSSSSSSSPLAQQPPPSGAVTAAEGSGSDVVYADDGYEGTPLEDEEDDVLYGDELYDSTAVAEAPSPRSAPQPAAAAVRYVTPPPSDLYRPQANPAPSRLALSYLYYQALEALYVKENVTLFVQRARDAAPYGHARLNWLLGVLHAYGLGVPRSERDALMYYAFAAMEGVPEAHMALGYRYRSGIGVRAGCEAALAHYREAADAVAMTYDGSAADLEGQTVTDRAGVQTIERGSRNTGGFSFFTYRDNVAHSDRAHKAQRDLMTLIYQADHHKPQAMLTLGYMYLRGTPQVRRDGRKALDYLERAAKLGVLEAHGALGNLYISGDFSITPPLPRNVSKAYEHYRRGSEEGDSVSLNGIGFLHAIGYLKEDALVTPAADGGSSSSSSGGGGGGGEDGLGVGAGHSGDFKTAALYFRRSGIPESTYNLAVLHLHGRGVPADRSRAQRLFWSAAQGGSVLARWQLAHLLDDAAESRPGECVKALELYKETASFGSWRRGSSSSGTGDSGLSTLLGQYGLDGSAATAAAARADDDRYDEDDDDYEEGEEEKGGSEERGDDATAPPGTEDVSGDPAAASSTAAAAADGGGGEFFSSASAAPLPQTAVRYERQLRRILRRLRSVEEGLRQSDSEDGPAMVSLASLVELLSLAETGDAASTWLAAQFVDHYLEVASDGEEAKSNNAGGSSSSSTDGAVVLLWPASTTAGTFLAPEPARVELLHYLLQRTVLHPRSKTSAHGAAYRRIGDLYYYGESAERGVDMGRALEFYRLAADLYHDPQALFNVGFMYQTGLHAAPRATVVPPDVVFAVEGDTNGGAAEAVWEVHANPPYHISGSPSFYLTMQAVGQCCDAMSTADTARSVDLYLAWKYYTASLRREGRGWMAVQVALYALNVQWSIRHFVPKMMQRLSSLELSGARRPMTLSEVGEVMRRAKNAEDRAAAVAAVLRQQQQRGVTEDAVLEEAHALLRSLKSMLHGDGQVVMAVLTELASMLVSVYLAVEQLVLVGAVALFLVALLVRHHAT